MPKIASLRILFHYAKPTRRKPVVLTSSRSGEEAERPDWRNCPSQPGWSGDLPAQTLLADGSE